MKIVILYYVGVSLMAFGASQCTWECNTWITPVVTIYGAAILFHALLKYILENV